MGGSVAFCFTAEIECPLDEVFGFFRDVDRHAGQRLEGIKALLEGKPAVWAGRRLQRFLGASLQFWQSVIR
jgi:hypothetical protein